MMQQVLARKVWPGDAFPYRSMFLVLSAHCHIPPEFAYIRESNIKKTAGIGLRRNDGNGIEWLCAFE